MGEHQRLRRGAVLAATAGLVSALAVAAPGSATGSATLAGSAPATAGVPAYHPSRLTHLGDARQVVVVTSKAWSSNHAVLRTWERGADGQWRLRGHAVAARVGRNGFVPASERRQNSLTSPAGTFAVVSAFGNGSDPGTALPYRRVDRTDWWTYDPRDPSTYNVLQPRRVASSQWRKAWAEHLSAYGGQYRYVAVLDFNLPVGTHQVPSGQRVADAPADTRLGGGIFLHVSGPGATAGCVSIPRASMRRVLRWLNRAAHPVLVMGPRSAITRL
jgi:L,D-peptidoglycan transpeptidase YkuD (ErfK/YbiS/YcfS/YnhG family)